MEPNILWHLETEQLNRATTKFKGKYSEISEEDWLFICHYFSLVTSQTKHLHVELNEVLKILDAEPLPDNWLTICTDFLQDNFNKYFGLYNRINKLPHYTSLKESVFQQDWTKILANRAFKDFDMSLPYLLWINLFKDITAQADWQNQLYDRFITLLRQCINNAFAANEDEKERCELLIKDRKFEEVIQVLVDKNTSYSILTIFLGIRSDLENRKISQPKLALQQLLQKQFSYWTQQNNQARSRTMFNDANRDTQIGTMNIEQYADRKAITQEQGLQKINSTYSTWKITPALKNYLMLYANQHGITQSFNQYFTSKMGGDTIAFSNAEKSVTVEYISPNRVRIITPVIYYSYQLPGIQRETVTSNTPVRYEFSSMIVEDTSPNSISESVDNIAIRHENSFYEVPDNNKLSPRLVSQMIREIINKIKLKQELNSREKAIIGQYCSRYINNVRQLDTDLLNDATNDVLFLLSYTEINYAFTIVNNNPLKEKLLTSEYNTDIHLIYDKYQKENIYIKSLNDNQYYGKFAIAKPLLDAYIDTRKKLIAQANNTNITPALARQADTTVNQIIALQNTHDLYDVIMTYNNEDKNILLKNPDIACKITTEQLMVLQRSSPNIAVTLLEPSFKISKLTDIWKGITNYINHPSHKLTQDDYFNMLENHPDLWQVEGGAFGKKSGFASSWLARTFTLARIPYGFSHRSTLTAETLVRCVTSDNDKARKAAISAIANDTDLQDKLLNSPLLLLADKSKLVRFYIESPDVLKKHIRDNTDIYEKMIAMNDNAINSALEINRVEKFNNIQLIGSFKDLFTKVPEHIAATRPIYLSEISKRIHSPRENKIVLGLIINALMKNDSPSFNDAIISHFAPLLIETIEQIKLLSSNPIVFTAILQTSLKDNHFYLNESLLAHMTTEPILNNEPLMDLVLDNLINKYNRGLLDTATSNYFAQIYCTNAKFTDAIEQRPELLNKILANANISYLTKMLNKDPTLIHDILEKLTTDKDARQRMLGEHGSANTTEEITEFITTLLKTTYHKKGADEYHSILALLEICQINPIIKISHIISNNPELQSYGRSELSDKLKNSIEMTNHIIENTKAKSNISKAMAFLSLTTQERKKYVTNNQIMQQIFEQASAYELNTIFSEYHPTLLNNWCKLIQESDTYSSDKIREIIISRADYSYLVPLFLHGGEANQKFILDNNDIKQKILADPSSMIQAYRHNKTIWEEINKNDMLIDRMLTAELPIKQQWVDVFLIATFKVKEKIVNNDKLLNNIFLLTNPLVLPQIIQVEPRLSTHIATRLLNHYLNTEFMKTLVDLHPALMSQMINHLNLNQLMELLSKTKLRTDNPVIKAIMENEDCCREILLDKEFRLQNIPDHQFLVRAILEKHPDLLEQINLAHMSEQQSVFIREIQEIDTSELQQKNAALSEKIGLFAQRAEALKKAAHEPGWVKENIVKFRRQ